MNKIWIQYLRTAATLMVVLTLSSSFLGCFGDQKDPEPENNADTAAAVNNEDQEQEVDKQVAPPVDPKKKPQASPQKGENKKNVPEVKKKKSMFNLNLFGGNKDKQ